MLEKTCSQFPLLNRREKHMNSKVILMSCHVCWPYADSAKNTVLSANTFPAPLPQLQFAQPSSSQTSSQVCSPVSGRYFSAAKDPGVKAWHFRSLIPVSPSPPVRTASPIMCSSRGSGKTSPLSHN